MFNLFHTHLFFPAENNPSVLFCHCGEVRYFNDGRSNKKEEVKKMIEELREGFEVLFPKDQEAIDGIRPSKSNRSAALLLWAQWEIILKKVMQDYE
jgi:hypothetical protein